MNNRKKKEQFDKILSSLTPDNSRTSQLKRQQLAHLRPKINISSTIIDQKFPKTFHSGFLLPMFEQRGGLEESLEKGLPGASCTCGSLPSQLSCTSKILLILLFIIILFISITIIIMQLRPPAITAIMQKITKITTRSQYHQYGPHKIITTSTALTRSSQSSWSDGVPLSRLPAASPIRGHSPPLSC